MNHLQLLSKHEVAAALDLSPETVARMARRGELPARLVAGRYRFDAAEVQAWLDAQRVPAQAEGER
jgi:excisionase family DNA binding protein